MVNPQDARGSMKDQQDRGMKEGARRSSPRVALGKEARPVGSIRATTMDARRFGQGMAMGSVGLPSIRDARDTKPTNHRSTTTMRVALRDPSWIADRGHATVHLLAPTVTMRRARELYA